MTMRHTPGLSAIDSLTRQIESLCERADGEGKANLACSLFAEAVSVLRLHKDIGVSKNDAYEALLRIHRRLPDGSASEALVGDLLDCVSGFTGNNEFWIYK